MYKFHRLLFQCFDNVYLGRNEKEVLNNTIRFRNFIKDLIAERREMMKKKNFINKGDFLTLLLNDEIFKDQDDLIVDECIAFMFAST